MSYRAFLIACLLYGPTVSTFAQPPPPTLKALVRSVDLDLGEFSNGMKRYLAEAKLVVRKQSPVFTPGGSHEYIRVGMGRSPKVQ